MTEGSLDNPYLGSPLKRTFDLLAALTALLILSPFMVGLAALIVATSGFPVFFRQERAGRGGEPFRIFKFRTMRPGSDRGLPLTGRGDTRVTRVGRILRAAKLDELPQLINVVRGEMSLVGPRPEVLPYVARYSDEERRVLATRPGITDPASIVFRDEERLLGQVEETRREPYYLKEVLPRKLALNLEYLKNANLGYDLAILIRTAWRLVSPDRP